MKFADRFTWGNTLALLLVLICAFVRPVSAGIVYVNKNAPGTLHDGASWATAFTAVQPAIDAASSGDEVWVAAGTYVGLARLGAGISLYGGFAGTETDRSRRDRTANVTTLDGNGSGPVVTMIGKDTVLDGFTIQNGVYMGGAAGVACTGPNAVIANNTVIHNKNSFSYGSTAGGGIGITSSATGTSVRDNVITDNNVEASYILLTGGFASGTGGGVYTDAPNVLVERNVISGNSATGIASMQGGCSRCWTDTGTASGGGLVVSRSGCLVRDNVITGNYAYGNASSHGGGVVAYGGALISNNTVVGNSAGSAGGMSVGGAETVVNNIVAYNSSGVAAPQGFGAVSHNDVFGNSTSNYSGVTDPTGAGGNISVDPLLVNRANSDYHLISNSPCIGAGDNSVVTPGETDLDGKPRIIGSHVDMGAYEAQALNRDPWTVTLGCTVTGGVTVAERTAYVAGNDGKLYARSTEDGSPIPGFPVDINAAVGATVKLPSRPAVYYGKTGKAIYLTTDRGDVLRILPTGQVAWHVRPVLGQTVSTPAVTPTGEVFVNLSTSEGPFNNYVFKLDEATGMPTNLSPFLGYTTASEMGDFSPAANIRYLYVNAGWGSRTGLTVLNQDNMVVRSSFAAGEQCLSPLLLGADLILASRGGKVFKMNAVTMNPDLGFGRFGTADAGGQISASPFADAAGNVYLGTADGRILEWAPDSPNFQPFYTTSGRIGGLTINRAAGVLGFGTSGGSFVQVPLDNPSGATTVSPGGPISTGTVYESLTDRFIVVTDNGVLSGYPSMR